MFPNKDSNLIIPTDYDSYEMTVLDQMRIEQLKKQIKFNGYKFKFFISNNNHYYSSYGLVQKHNKEIRRTIRKFYKYDIKMIFFIERGENGSYHRHFLVEDLPEFHWEHQRGRIKNWLDPTDFFYCLSGEGLPDSSKINLLDRVIRMLPFISNGNKALDIRPIHNLDKLLAYCTKQFEIHHPSYDVIDSAASDIDPGFYLHNKQIGDQWHPRFCEDDRSYRSMNPPPRPI